MMSCILERLILKAAYAHVVGTAVVLSTSGPGSYAANWLLWQASSRFHQHLPLHDVMKKCHSACTPSEQNSGALLEEVFESHTIHRFMKPTHYTGDTHTEDMHTENTHTEGVHMITAL